MRWACGACSRCRWMGWTAFTLFLLVLPDTLNPAAAGFLNLQYDTDRDWISGIVSQGPTGCILSPRDSERPMPALDAPKPGGRTVEEIRQLGWKLAPVVYMHPQEWSQLADPAKWLEDAVIYDPLTLEPEPLHTNRSLLQTFQYLTVLDAHYFTSRIFHNLDSQPVQALDTATLKDRIRGDAVDTRNHSTARIWYTANDAANLMFKNDLDYTEGTAVVFKFHYFFPFNGCSNQVFALNLDAKHQGIEYYICPYGVHEGDWEHISMLVSVADWNDSAPHKAIKRVQYSAHSWNTQYDCDLGECAFEVDEMGLERLVAFAGLYSHALYPSASPLWVYTKVSAELLLSVDGVYLGDRTAKGGAMFQPSESNTRFLPPLTEMSEEQRQGEYAWAAFSGSWGGYLVSSDQVAATCFYDNFTRTGPCQPDNPATAFLNYFLSLNLPSLPGGTAVASLDDLYWRTVVTKPYVVDALTGPLMRKYTFEWEIEQQSPLYDGSSTGLGLSVSAISCPFAGPSTRTKQYGDDYEEPNIFGFLVGVGCMITGTGVFFWLLLLWPGLHRASDLKPLLRLIRVDAHSFGSRRGSTPSLADPALPREAFPAEEVLIEEYKASRHLGWMFIAMLVYLMGMGITLIGIRDMFHALRMIIDLSIYATVQVTLNYVVIMLGTWQLIVLLCCLFVRNQEYLELFWLRVVNPFRNWNNASKAGMYLQTGLAALHVIAANTSMLLFGVGCTLTIARLVFQMACNGVLRLLFSKTPVASLCLDLGSLGIDRVICGVDLAQTCSRWHGLHIEYLAWGGLLFLLSHMLFLNMSVHQIGSLCYLQAVMEHMGLQPSRKKLSRHLSLAPDAQVELNLARSPQPEGVKAWSAATPAFGGLAGHSYAAGGAAIAGTSSSEPLV